MPILIGEERGELNEGIFFRDSLKNYDKTKSHWIDGASTILQSIALYAS